MVLRDSLPQYHGKAAMLRVDYKERPGRKSASLRIPVNIIEAKWGFGRSFFKVTPIGGEGERRVAEESLTLPRL